MSAEFRIGESLVDPAVGSVAGKDATVHLEPRVMEVLVYLARHPGEVIPKERLIQAGCGPTPSSRTGRSVMPSPNCVRSWRTTPRIPATSKRCPSGDIV